jgi:para-nitrobenzyl esterase
MKRPLSLLILLILLSATMFLFPASTYASISDPSLVQTTAGTIRGIVTPNERQFLGIPFAAPPVGNLRWKPPQPPTSWGGIRSATTFGNACIQPDLAQLTGIAQGSRAAGSEDCLYLNVYTPNPVGSAGNLPVMVWIYGGGFVFGAGSYNPAAIVQQGHVIVVTFNYRLGPFGFLALPGLSAEDPHGSSGDYGLQDQQAALRWVKANIASFGGNPNNVTIFGESAGGSSVCDQIASPLAAGLFQKAITESGPCEGVSAFSTPSLSSAQQNGTAFAAKAGCTGSDSAIVSCMRALSATTLLNDTTSDLADLFSGSGLTFIPVVDGSVLTEPVVNALASGSYNHVPVIEGTNHDEGALFVLLQFLASGRLTAAGYTANLQKLFGPAAPLVQARYPVNSSTSPDQAYARVFTDVAFACPAHTADRLFAASVPTYAYEFNDPDPLGIDALATTLLHLDFTLGDMHASEVPYVFDGILNTVGGVFPELAGESVLPYPLSLLLVHPGLSHQMVAYWTNFAATGDPNGFGLPHWFPYNPDSDQFQSLTSTGSGPISNFASEHQCSFWATLGI